MVRIRRGYSRQTDGSRVSTSCSDFPAFTAKPRGFGHRTGTRPSEDRLDQRGASIHRWWVVGLWWPKRDRYSCGEVPRCRWKAARRDRPPPHGRTTRTSTRTGADYRSAGLGHAPGQPPGRLSGRLRLRSAAPFPRDAFALGGWRPAPHEQRDPRLRSTRPSPTRWGRRPRQFHAPRCGRRRLTWEDACVGRPPKARGTSHPRLLSSAMEEPTARP